MLSSTYLFLTCVKNNAIGLIHVFMDDDDWYRANSAKICPGAVYMCLMLGHTALLRLLLNNTCNIKLLNHIDNYLYAVDVALRRGHYDTVIWFVEYLKR